MSKNLDFGNTEVAPWHLGKKYFCADVRVQKLACGLRNQPYYDYSTMIFPAVDSGSFILRFRQKKMPIFWLGGPQIHGNPKSVAYEYLFIVYLSIQPKKHIWTTVKLVIVCSDWYFHG